MRTISHVLVAAAAIAGAGITGLTAAEQPGRYSMSPAEGGGFARLDTQTGQMSLCNRKDGQWVCQDMADTGRGLSDEVERLRKENKDLRAEIRRMEDLSMGGDKSGPPGAAPAPRAERPNLPTEEDVDKAMTYLQRMFRKFRDKLKEFEDDNKGTPL